jgi:hypothetical protein
MENEMNASITISIELLVISVILSVLMLFVTMGQTFSREVTTQVAATQAETYGTELVSAGEYGALPATSLYTILQKNKSSLGTLSGSAYGVNITTADDLTYLFSKKIRVTVTPSGDMYNLIVGPE